MSGCRTIYAHELRLLLYAPLTYIFLLGFLVTLSICIFWIADFYATDQASVRLLQVFLPWISLVFVPTLAMRVWADEYNDRSIELLFTLPLPLYRLVLGKFLAGYTILALAVVGTLPFLATVYYLGEPDPGRVMAVYLAILLLLAVFYALAMLIAASLREPISSFVIGVFVLLVLLLLGSDSFSSKLLEALRPFGLKIRYEALGSGLLTLADIGYFVTLAVAALIANSRILDAWRSGQQRWSGALKVLLLGLLALGLIALLDLSSNRLGVTLDITEEREFTLSDHTRQLSAKLPAQTLATLYWSASQATVPAAIKAHAKRIQTLLRQIEYASQRRLKFSQVDPVLDTDEELNALAEGMQKIPMSSGDSFFLGLILRHGEKTVRIPYFDLQRDRHLEYDIAVALNNLQRERTPKIGILSPLLAPSALQQPRPGLSFLNELKRAYDLAVIPYFKEQLPPGLDVLIVLQPSILKQSMLYEIDQYLMHGGRLILTLDPYLRFDRASNEIALQVSSEINDIADLLLRYGLRYEGDSIVGDNTLAATVSNAEQQTLSYPYWLKIPADHMAAEHPVTASLREVFMVETGALSLSADSKAQALIRTSPDSGEYPRAEYSGSEVHSLALAFQPDSQQRIIAATLDAPLSSAFAEPPPTQTSHQHKAHSQSDPLLFVIADSDWLFDPFSLQVSEAGDYTVTRPLNDNHALLLNMVEYASSGGKLTTIRSRGTLNRSFTRVAALFRSAEQQYRQQETELTERIADLETRLSEIIRLTGVQSLEQLPDSVRSQSLQLRGSMLNMQKELRAIRHTIRAQIERLGQRIKLLNLLAGPLFVLMLAWLAILHRRRIAKAF